MSIRWGLHVVKRTRTSCYCRWKRCWLVFSYHGEFSRFQVSKYIEYSAYTGCISLYIYCLITCNIKSLLNVPKISHISRKISQVSRFPAKSPDSRNKCVFLPKQPLLELSPPVIVAGQNSSFTRFYNTRKNIERRLRRKQNRERNREFKQRRLWKPSITEEGKNQK